MHVIGQNQLRGFAFLRVDHATIVTVVQYNIIKSAVIKMSESRDLFYQLK